VSITRNVVVSSSLWVFLSSLCVKYILSLNISSNLSEQAPSEAEAQCAELARGGKVPHSDFMLIAVVTFL
jgi:hypothetical protein